MARKGLALDASWEQKLSGDLAAKRSQISVLSSVGQLSEIQSTHC